MKTKTVSGAVVTVSPIYTGGEDAMDARPPAGTYTTFLELTGRFRPSRPLLITVDGRQVLTETRRLRASLEVVTGSQPLLSYGTSLTFGLTEWAIICEMTSRIDEGTPFVEWFRKPVSVEDRCDRCLALDLAIDVRGRLVCDRCGVVEGHSPEVATPVSHFGLLLVVLMLGLVFVFIALQAK